MHTDVLVGLPLATDNQPLATFPVPWHHPAMPPRIDWTRDQQLVALRTYMRLPFGKLHGKNPEIISIARQIGRTPGALAMKACNFASLDPDFRRSGRSGLSRTSEADRAIWIEFAHNAEALAAEAEEAFARFHPAAATDESDIEIPTGETEVTRLIRARRVQSFFRAAVLTSYEHRCAVSGLAIPELLIASHIIPWRDNVERRADPRNGLCLNALFDRAFDRGLMSFDENLRVIISRRLKGSAQGAQLKCSLLEAEGQPLRVPLRFLPDRDAMQFHRVTIFKGD